MSDADDVDRRMEEFQRGQSGRSTGGTESDNVAGVTANVKHPKNLKYRTVHINAQMREIKKEKKIKVKVATKKVTKGGGIFNKGVSEVEVDVFEERVEWVGTGNYYDNYIDKRKLSEDIQNACNHMEREGYELFSTSEIISGRYNFHTSAAGFIPNMLAYSYGYGYSVTDGVILLFKKISSAEVSNAQQA